MRRVRPALLHVHFANEAMRVVKVAKLTNTPVVVTLHGRDVTEAPGRPGARGWLYRKRLKGVFGDATTIIAVSSHIADRAVQLGANPSKVVVHHIGVPIPPKCSAPYEVRSGILAVGRLVEKKGFSHLIRAVAQLPDHENFVITIVGEGPERDSLRSLAQGHKVKVRFVGSADHDQVLKLMQGARLVCVPSIRSMSGDEEGLPTVVMEAGACSTPVVGYMHSGIPEAIQHEVTGLLVPEGDIDRLAEAIRRVIGDISLGRTLGENARKRIESSFDIVRQTAQLEDIYDRSISKV